MIETGSVKHGNETWVRWESREMCSYAIGFMPYAMRLGMALAKSGARGVVIWPPEGEPVFVECQYAHFLVQAAMEAAQIDLPRTFDEWMAGVSR